MTALTDEKQPSAWPILFAGMPTTGTRLRGIVRIDFDGHALLHERFVSNHGVQLSKRPLGVRGVRFALFLRGMLPFASLRAFTNVGQVLQPDDAVGVLAHNALAYDMVGVSFQPSLSSTDGDQPSGCGTSAFVLKTLSQSCIMVRFAS